MGAAATTARAAVTIGGPFELTGPNGSPVTDATYRGKWLLVYFGYTSCPDTCPTTLLDIGQTLTALGADAEKLQPLFITVDPARDTREAMDRYMQSFDPRIAALTGSTEQIAAVARAYGAYIARRKTGPGQQDYVVDHSTYLYVMNPEGRFVRGFDADASAGEMAGALRTLMGQGGQATQ